MVQSMFFLRACLEQQPCRNLRAARWLVSCWQSLGRNGHGSLLGKGFFAPGRVFGEAAHAGLVRAQAPLRLGMERHAPSRGLLWKSDKETDESGKDCRSRGAAGPGFRFARVHTPLRDVRNAGPRDRSRVTWHEGCNWCRRRSTCCLLYTSDAADEEDSVD